MSGSVLETFWILFDSDASKVKKGAEEAEVSTTGLNQKLLSTEEISAALGSSFLRMATQAAEAFAAIFAVQKVIGGAIENAEFAKHIKETAESLGVSTQALGAWSDAVKHIGGSAEGAVDSFKALSGSLAQVDATGHSRVKPFFDELHINMKDAQGNVKNVTQLLWDLSGAFEHMSKQESYGFGRKMQLDDGMIRLLQQGQSGLLGLITQMHKLGDITPESGEAMVKFDEALADAEHSARTFGFGITDKILPALTNLINWFNENGDTISTVLGTIAAGVGLITARIIILKTVAAGGLILGELGEVVAFLGLINDALQTATVLELLMMTPISLIAAAFAAVSYGVYEIYENWQDIIGAIEDAYNWTLKLFGLDSDRPGSEAVDNSPHASFDYGISEAQKKLAVANSTTLGAQTSSSISNSQSASNENHLHIDNITIQTQATNAQDISGNLLTQIKSEFNKHFRQTVNDSDDGIKG